MNTSVFFPILRGGGCGTAVSYHNSPEKEESEGICTCHFTVLFIMVMSTDDSKSKVLNSIQDSTKIHPEKGSQNEIYRTCQHKMKIDLQIYTLFIQYRGIF
jgi:hypothetical protein